MCFSPYLMVHPQAKSDFAFGRIDSFCFDGHVGRLTHVSFGFRHWFLSVPNSDGVLASDKYRDSMDSLDDHFYFFNSDGTYSLPMFFLAPCGKCNSCLSSKYSELSARLSLECLSHDYPPIFFTLTYDSEHLPADSSVSKSDISTFIKNFQTYMARVDPSVSPRFFIVSEYGPRFTRRPHYHGLIFGVDISTPEKLSNFESVYYRSWPRCLRKCMPFEVARNSFAISRYCSKYVLKGLRNGKSNVPEGRLPNFISTPRRKGLGSLCLSNPDIFDQIVNSKSSVIEVKTFCAYSPNPLGVNTIRIPRYILNKLFPSLSRILPPDFKRLVSWTVSIYESIKPYYLLSSVDTISYHRILSILDYENHRDFWNYRRKSVPFVNGWVLKDVNSALKLFTILLNRLKSLIVSLKFLDFDFILRYNRLDPIRRSAKLYRLSHPDRLLSSCMVSSIPNCTPLDYSLNL